MDSYTDCSHNMLYTLNRAKWRADLLVSSKADITGYQEVGGEATRDTLRQWCMEKGRELFIPKGSNNPISWDPKVFGCIDDGIMTVHKAAAAYGVDKKMEPARTVAWVGLKHKSSGKRVLRINVHPLSGATKTSPDWTKEASQWKNWGAQQYWLDVLGFSAEALSRPDGLTTTKRYWDVVTLGGDYNGDLLQQKDDEWYYPSRILPTLYVPDTQKGGLDHLQHSHGSDCGVIKRWKVSGNTDHLIHFVKRSFKPVDDTPGA